MSGRTPSLVRENDYMMGQGVEHLSFGYSYVQSGRVYLKERYSTLVCSLETLTPAMDRGHTLGIKIQYET